MHDLRALGQRARHLVPGRVNGHHDGGIHAELARGPGDRLAVVAGRIGDHAPGALLGVQRQQRIERAAQLE
ncbi:hypothetical protein D3C78_1776960 [compost metagenome]